MRDTHAILPAAILLAYAALAVAWSFVIPLGGGLDEPRHLRYLQIVALEARLPTPAEKAEAISHHPPLHYLLATPLYLAVRGLGEEAAWHALRLLQVVFGGAVLVFVYLTMRRLLPDRPGVALAAMATVGLLPHFLLVCAMFTNDVSAALGGAVLAWLTVRVIADEGRELRLAVAAGLVGAAAVFAKMNALVLLPPALLALVAAPLVRGRSGEPPEERRRADPGSQAVRNGLGFLAGFLVIGGPLLAWYLGTWGRLDADPPWPEMTWPVHTFGGKLWRAIDGLYRSTWAQVGWLPGPHSAAPPGPSALWPRPDLETPLLALMLPLVLIGLVGSALLMVRWLRSPRTRSHGLALAFLLATAACTWAAVAHSAVYVNPGRFEGGRYLMPGILALMAPLAVGPLALPGRGRVVAWLTTVALLLVMNAVAFWEFYAYLIPTFAP